MNSNNKDKSRAGFYTLSIKGKEYILHFSTNFWINLWGDPNSGVEKFNRSIPEIQKGNITVENLAIMLIYVRAVIYHGHNAYLNEEAMPEKISIEKAGTLLDNLEDNVVPEIIKALNKSKILGISMGGPDPESVSPPAVRVNKKNSKKK